MSQPVDIDLERIATGGEAVGRLDDGRVVFVLGGLPGEQVRAMITEEKKRFARATVTEVLQPAAERTDPSCQHAQSGECGGCDWMYVHPDAQRGFKQDLVVEQLTRLGKIAEPKVETVDHERGRRTTVRCLVVDGQLGYRARRSDLGFRVQSCGAAHPLIEDIIVSARFPGAAQVTLRASVATGERIAIVDGDPTSAQVPDGVVLVSATSGDDASISETVGGRSWRISAHSFFQTSDHGAEALVQSVRRQLDGVDGTVVDLYAGVGLLGGAAAGERLRTAVEQNPSSVKDARHNLGPDVVVHQGRVERWVAEPHLAVIADPARRGLAADGVGVIDRTGAEHLVLVSCDPASLGRDAALLGESGWQHEQSELIDMFPDTSRIEVVSRFRR